VSVQRAELLYEGKAKKVYATTDPTRHVIEHKDDATAFNAQKRGTIAGKGEVNAAVASRVFEFLAEAGVPTHLEALISPREQLVKAVRIVPLEVVVRNRAAGSFAKRYGVPEGGELDPVVIEWCLKDDALGDPLINDAAAVALGVVTPEELESLFELTTEVNDLLKPFFAARGLDLVDFKLEFGVDHDGNVLLADEISPDTCRLWDASTGDKLDKDRFRRDLGGVEEAYREVRERVLTRLESDAEIVRDHLAERETWGLGGHHDHEHAHGRDDGHGHAHDHVPGVAQAVDGPGRAGAAPSGPAGPRTYNAVVDVMLRRSILDPQGRAVEATVHRLGHLNVSGVRVGKRITFAVAGEREAVEAQVAALATDLLSNPVMEDAVVQLEPEVG